MFVAQKRQNIVDETDAIDEDDAIQPDEPRNVSGPSTEALAKMTDYSE
jgi:hypothetical protein